MSNLTLKFDQSSIGDLERKVKSGIEKLRNDAVIATSKVVVQHAKQGGFKDRTRQLRSTIASKPVGMIGNYFTAEVRAPKDYASFVEKGTDPHDIWPKAAYGHTGPLLKGQTVRGSGPGPHEHHVGRGYALRWKNDAGQIFFATMVHHPGGKAIPFMLPAFEYGRDYWKTFVRRGFVEINARLGH
jgi:hypothetical protein